MKAGFVASAESFSPLVAGLRGAPEREDVHANNGEQLRNGADALKRRCRGMTLDSGRRRVLADVRPGLDGARSDAPYAVRSSSPVEDPDCASFAGAFGTEPAVSADGLEPSPGSTRPGAFDGTGAVLDRDDALFELAKARSRAGAARPESAARRP